MNGMPRIVTWTLMGLAALVLLLVLFVNSNIAALAELIHPGSALLTHAALLGAELLALAFFWRGLFRRRKHLLLLDAPTPEQRREFAAELTRRMRGNASIREAGLLPEDADDDAYLERCLAVLHEKADEEIRRNAKRIFLATALSQNGRIDALIVFLSLCRLIWRVSGIYNQNPHPREIASLYWAVVSTVFLSLSIEELDISTEITVGFGEAFHAIAPAGLTASIPFAGKMLHTFTASTIDGAANCYLALRAGIITRNAYAYALKTEERPGRAAVFKEAGAQLLGMSQELVDKLASTLAENLAGAAKSAGGKTMRAGRDFVGGIGAGAGRLASGTVGAVQGAGSGIAKAGGVVGGLVSGTLGRAASGAWRTLKKPLKRK